MKDLDRAAKRLDSLKQREPVYMTPPSLNGECVHTRSAQSQHKAKPSKESEAAIAKQQEAIRVIRIQQIKKKLTALGARGEKLLRKKSNKQNNLSSVVNSDGNSCKLNSTSRRRTKR